MAATPKVTPSLTPEILADSEAVAARIDQLLRADPQYRQHTKTILRAQDALRRVLADREWREYLDVEAAVNFRLDCALMMVARWAFEEGRLHTATSNRP